MEAAHLSHSPSPPPRRLRFFHDLPSALFSLPKQFLPLPDKLLHLTLVCHSFPALAPPSFACDTLAWTSTLMAQVSRSLPPPLLSLLSLVPFALFADDS